MFAKQVRPEDTDIFRNDKFVGEMLRKATGEELRAVIRFVYEDNGWTKTDNQDKYKVMLALHDTMVLDGEGSTSNRAAFAQELKDYAFENGIPLGNEQTTGQMLSNGMTFGGRERLLRGTKYGKLNDEIARVLKRTDTTGDNIDEKMGALVKELNTTGLTKEGDAMLMHYHPVSIKTNKSDTIVSADKLDMLREDGEYKVLLHPNALQKAQDRRSVNEVINRHRNTITIPDGKEEKDEKDEKDENEEREVIDLASQDSAPDPDPAFDPFGSPPEKQNPSPGSRLRPSPPAMNGPGNPPISPPIADGYNSDLDHKHPDEPPDNESLIDIDGAVNSIAESSADASNTLAGVDQKALERNNLMSRELVEETKGVALSATANALTTNTLDIEKKTLSALTDLSRTMKQDDANHGDKFLDEKGDITFNEKTGDHVRPEKDSQNRSVDAMRPLYGMAGSGAVIPPSMEQIRSDLEFDLFSVVPDGYGLGSNNKMFIQERIRDEKLIGAGRLYLPRPWDGPTGGIDTQPPEFQNVMTPSVIKKFQRRSLDDALERAKARRALPPGSSLNVLGDDVGYQHAVSDRGLKRSSLSVFEPVIVLTKPWEPVNIPIGAVLSAKRQFRREFDAMRYPDHFTPHMNMSGGPTEKRRRVELRPLQ
jgi:hypothetical protein